MIVIIASQCDTVGPLLFKVLSQRFPCHLMIVEEVGKFIFFGTKGVTIHGQKLSYDHVKITFNRMVNINAKYLHRCQSWQNLMLFLEQGPSVVVNRPEVVMGNFFKPCQMKALSMFFHIPKTFVASYTPLSIHNMVVKSISSVRSIVGHAKDLEVTHAMEPIMIQRCYKGFHVRLHVIGDFHTAVCVFARSIDYRYCHQAQFATFQCPEAVIEKAKAFMVKVGAIFCGFDFIVHHRRWICLEANMSPGFVYFDHQCQKPLVMKEVVHWVQTFF